MPRLVVISNRVAVPKARGVTGAQGGLAGALNSALKSNGGIWFGWSGQETDSFTGSINYVRSADGVTTATIDLEPQDVEEYYNGYANSTLWPLFHYRIDLTQYEREFGKGYERVNERFAESVLPLVEKDDQVWVHDYHLLPLAENLRKSGLDNRIGFFLHTPWPPTNLFVSLPFHERLVAAMLRYDLIGFQCDAWLESFQHYCWKELGAEVDYDTGEITYAGHTTLAKAYPIGIDHEFFAEKGASEEAVQAEKRLAASARDRTVMIGVDRLDYSKGLPERLDGIGRFFDRHPDRVRDLVYIQIAPPSREDIGSYQDIRTTLEQKAGQINGERSDVDLVPIRYVNQGYAQEDLFGFYRASKICLVTPLRDGMNLVAKEYVAAQDPEDPGVLVLSRFAGAAQQLDCGGQGALLVNPHSSDDVAHNIRLALDMPLKERKARYKKLIKTVREENVQRWTENFIADLDATGND